MIDLLIEGKAYVNGTLETVAIGLENGKIVSVSKPSNAPKADKRITVKDREIILPGMIDMHVHLRDLNQSYKEDWFTGTFAALKGGVTLIADMPNNDPYINSLEKLKMKLEVARKKSLVDFLLYSGVPKNLEEIPEIRKIACGFKVYPQDYERLSDFLKMLNNDLVVIHSEDPKIIERNYNLFKRRLDAKLHSRIRPKIAEIKAITKIIKTVKNKQLKLHFTHITTKESIREIVKAKLSGVNVTCDATLHHSLLTSDIVNKLGGIAKTNPPLRGRSDAKSVFNAIRFGLVDAIASDHAPHRLEEKLQDDYDSIPPGYPGLEICLPIILTEILEKRLNLNVIDLYSKEPARILGIRRGSINPGFNGDIVIVELGKERKIRGSDFVSKAKYTPFEGRTVKATVKKVFIRGSLALDDGELIVNGGFGINAHESYC